MPKNQKQKVVAVIGPTASGKSDLGIFLARKFGGEIISADSRQVYVGMDIGTGKVTKKEQRLAKHHLLDVASPKKVFTVSDFKKLGQKALFDIASRNRLPIIVGGTGFYIDALVHNIAVPEVSPNKKLRAELAKQSAEQLFSRLSALDPRRAKTIDPKNKRRLIRALEIVEVTGKVPALNTKYEVLDTKYDILWLGLKPKNLEKRIVDRVTERLKRGAVGEVKKLIKSGVSKKRIRDLGLGYREIIRFLDKEISQEEMRREFVKSEIKYSKRQMTWFKRKKEIHWVKSQKEAEGLVGQFII